MPTRPAAHRAKAPGQRRHDPLTAAQRGYGSAWRRVRLAYLAEHPLCVYCEAEGKLTPATCIDHVKAHKGDSVLFWDESNWAASCAYHNDVKRVREEGGFGRVPK